MFCVVLGINSDFHLSAIFRLTFVMKSDHVYLKVLVFTKTREAMARKEAKGLQEKEESIRITIIKGSR